MSKETIVLQATKRDVIGKQVKALRREGKLPAVIYGKHVAPIPILLEAHETNRILAKVGSSHLLQIVIDGKEHTVLVRDRQRDFIKGGLIHVDFLAVSMTEKLRTEIRLELSGVSPAVSDFGAILVTGVTEVEIECLPKDLVDLIHVDVSGLKKIGSSISVQDLKIPDGVTLLTNPHEMVVQVVSPAGEEVVPVAAPEGVIEPEVVEKGKKEKEEEEG
jgi:large subunit ribosomal protein L25